MTATNDLARSTREVAIVPMTQAYAEEVLAIYQAGLDTGDASFETTAPDWETWDATHLPHHRLVAVEQGHGRVVGWVAVASVSARRVYAGVVEHSLYVHPRARGRGVGSALLKGLIHSTEEAGLWTIETGIFPENIASVALHRAHGFRIVGIRERIARHRGRWRDVLLLERRSQVVS
ncbi:MAG: GNAT family N-acetyltransferase [Streptosporangiaceae bacterium]